MMLQCPGCDYRKAEHEIRRSSINFACPRCGQYAISQFVAPKAPEPVFEADPACYDAYGWQA